MSRYDDEHFLLWFTRPTPTWLELSAEARGVAISVAMVLNPKSGEVTLRRGLASLVRLVQIPWEKLEPALAELIAAEKLTWDGSRFVLSDPEFATRRRKTSADRMRDKRERDRPPSSAPPPPKSDECDAAVTQDPCDARDALSSLVLSSLVLDQDLKSTRDAKPDPVVRPPWFDAACDTVEMQTGETLNRPVAWLGYYGHRASPESAKGMSQPDALYWLTKVDIRDARKDRQAAADKREREARWDKERQKPGAFVEPQRITAEQQRELVEKYPMRTRRELDAIAEAKSRKGAA